MKRLSKFLHLSTLVLLYSFASLQSVYGDDTEIFFAPADDIDDVRPNIMFIIDSSGSMGWGVDGTTGVAHELKRMTIVQDVMDTVLQDLTNVNAGLMRFNNGMPGPVVYPVLNVDLPATPRASSNIIDGNNDVVESAGIASIVDQEIQINNTDYVAFRFENVNIPQGALIESANVIFTADGDSTGAGDILISAENVDSSAPLTGAVSEIQTKADTNRVASIVNWTMTDWVDGGHYATDDLSSVVQDVTDRPGWCGGNDLTILIRKGSGALRSAYSAEGVIANTPIDPNDVADIYAPRIKIKFSQTVFIPGATKCFTNEAVSQIFANTHDFVIQSDGIGNGGTSALWIKTDPVSTQTRQSIGMTFNNINVPQGATVNFAYLSFTAERASSDSSETNISAFKSYDVLAPTAYTSLDDSPTTNVVNWQIANNWVANGVYNSEDVAPIVQELVDQAAWAPNNDMAFILTGVSGHHSIKARENLAAGTKLHIGYRGVYSPGLVTIRDDLRQAVQDLVPSGGTPISGTLEEAGRYFLGDPAFWGLSRNNSNISRVSHELSYETSGNVVRNPACTDANLDAAECASELITGGPDYVSPIEESCQTSHIVYLTDGFLNSHQTATETTYNQWTGGSGSCSGGNDCSVDMVRWLHTNDLADSIPGAQTVTTHMIGFGAGADPDLMRDMAHASDTEPFAPQDREALVKAINDIVSDIADVNTTFVTSGVTVNQFNRITHNDQLYFSLFTPEEGSTWPGNIKRYRLQNGVVVDSTTPDGVIAVGGNGEFTDSAVSFWSSVVDGNDVKRGGVTEQLTKGSRNVYTNFATGSLTVSGNLFNSTNISETLLGGGTPVTALRKTTILDWADGYDVIDPAYNPADVSTLTSTPIRKNIGDPLHSAPTLLQYNDSSGALSSTRLYVGTNHGFLHSFDADNGSEHWSFIPQELIPDLDGIVSDAPGAHTYGLDGTVSIYLQDGNGNGAVDTGDKAYLYVGMRRGGNSYFAFDITLPDTPKFLFKIDPTVSGYSKLGQTWSKPTIAKMNVGGANADTSKLVMIFGGGYDTDQDAEGTATNNDDVGNVVYIANAIDGKMLWDSSMNTDAPGGSAGSVSYMNSVSSDVVAFDLDNDADGFIDNFYVTDSRAQIFRFDVDNGAGTIKGGRIAHLSDGIDKTDNRRFYYNADAALIRKVGDNFVSVSVGSGFRAHPLNTDVIDHFYVVQDRGILTGNFDMDASLSDLVDVSSLADDDSNGVSNQVELLNDPSNNKKGWYIGFTSTGEKVLANSITFNNVVLFTTYVPPGADGDVCQAAAGKGRLYAMNILNGNPFVDNNADDTLTENDRFVDLLAGGIAPPPTIVFDGSLTPRLCVGTDCSLAGDCPSGSDCRLPPVANGLMGIKWRRTSN